MRITLNLFLGLLSLAILAACGKAPEGQNVEAEAAQAVTAEPSGVTYTVNTATSQVDWVGSKKLGDKHTGYLKVKEGQLEVNDGNLIGGKFVLDINSLTVTDLPAGDGKEDLEGHLKNEDFFDAPNYPTATFEITSVAAATDNAEATHNITGNLTLKNITKSITIPAKVKMTDGQLMASTPAFNIDRTQWNMQYGSGITGVAQNKIINDEVNLVIRLEASK